MLVEKFGVKEVQRREREELGKGEKEKEINSEIGAIVYILNFLSY